MITNDEKKIIATQRLAGIEETISLLEQGIASDSYEKPGQPTRAEVLSQMVQIKNSLQIEIDSLI